MLSWHPNSANEPQSARRALVKVGRDGTVLKRYRPSDPSIDHIPTRRAEALERYGDYLDELAVNS